MLFPFDQVPSPAAKPSASVRSVSWKPARRALCLLGCCLAAIPSLLSAADAPAADPASAKADSPADRPDYTLQPSDLIHVQVFQEPDLEREVRLSQECTVALPLIGTVDLKGKTVRQAEDLIRGLYDRDYIVNPQVNVIVKEYASKTVTVLGAVNKAGVVSFPLEQPLTLLDAIARADGFSRLADRSRLKLTRNQPNGKSETRIIDADEIIKGASKDQIVLQKDDVIYVPERLL
jgi:polysaccharide biosynthesis/export protein